MAYCDITIDFFFSISVWSDFVGGFFSRNNLRKEVLGDLNERRDILYCVPGSDSKL